MPTPTPFRRFFRYVFCLTTLGACCHAQGDPAVQLARQLRADVSTLAGHGTLGAWQKTHPGEKVERAHYISKETPEEFPEDFVAPQHNKCAVFVAELPGSIARRSSFYVPLPGDKPLPSLQDNNLRQLCELDHLGYILPSALSYASVANTLESVWGQANGESEEIGFSASLQWKALTAWHRNGWNIWLMAGQGMSQPSGSWAIFVRRSGMPSDTDLLSTPEWFSEQVKAIGEESAPELAAIAALDATLTSGLVKGTRCATGTVPGDAPAADRLEEWLNAAKRLPPTRRAAALLLADSYLTCIVDSPGGPSRERFISMGARFDRGCSQDGGDYGHTFREEAMKLDTAGTAGAWAQLADLWTWCSVENATFASTAEKLLQRFPKWRPWLYYMMGRAHGTRLAFSFPGGFPDDGPEVLQLSTSERRKERLAAIQAFRAASREAPNKPVGVLAWREAWRLLAGLNPDAVEFGCTCE